MEQNKKNIIKNNTRVAKWAKYRESIYNDIELHKEVINSDERLSLLYERLIKIIPNYESIFSTEKKINITSIKKEEVPLYDLKKLENIIDKLSVEDTPPNFDYIDKLSFSTGELDTIIKDLEEWNPRNSKNVHNVKNIYIDKVKKVEL